MKTISKIKYLIVLAAVLPASQIATATVYTWNWTNGVSADTYWSDSANWSPTGVPGASDFLIFNSINSGGQCVAPGAGLAVAGGGQSQVTIANFNGMVDASFGGAVSSMLCSNLGSSYQNILISNNLTLTITNGLTVGNGVVSSTTGAISPGSGGIDFGTTIVNVTIAGTNATLLMNNPNENLWVAEGSANNNSTTYATLDLSALDYFTATMNRLLVGDPAVNRPGSVLYLAATNNITAEYQTTGVLTSDTIGTGAIVVGESSSNGGGSPDDLYLGLVNTISADTIAVSRQKQAHSEIAFNPNLLGPQVPVATIQGFSSSQVQTWDIGDGVANSGTDTCNGTVDFTLGIVNAAVNAMYVGKGPSAGTGANKSTGALTFGAGTININSLFIGYQNVNSAPTGSGTVTVNTNSTYTNYATLIVNSNLYLADTLYPAASGAVNTTGILNIAGGTVWANNILAGTNGNSTINQTAGTLLVSNFAGSSSAPVTTINLEGVLQLFVSGGIPVMVGTTVTINGPVTVNIAALPVITGFPVQYPLIKGVNPISGDFSQITLSSLPAVTGNNPAYQGILVNDTANNSIDLQLTNGPVVTGSYVWTGAASSNWDLTTVNWNELGTPEKYFNGVPVLFDDSAQGPTNVNLTTTLSPAEVTVSNTVLAYTFSGPGALAGAGALVKTGTNRLLIANTGNNTFTGGMVISNGTVQFGDGGADGSFPSLGAGISNNGTLIFDQTLNVSIASAITGTGSVIQEGLDALDLTASNSYSGLTLVTGGTVLLDGWLNGGMLTNAPGTTVGGNGTNLGPFSVAGTINPGDVNAIGTLTAGDGLTLWPNAVAYFDLNPGNNTPGSGVNDLLQVAGNLNVNNNIIWANFQGTPASGAWQVMSYTGSLNGAANFVLSGTHYTGIVDTSQSGVVNVDITGESGANLKWNSTASGVWDNTTSNWYNFGTLRRDFFGAGDNVQFDDSAPGLQTNITLAAGIVVYPNSVTNISTNNYTISGAGTIAGSASLVKDGPSTLTINTTNSYTGGTAVLNGTLLAGSTTPVGPDSINTILTITNNGTLDVNGQDLETIQLYVSGAGFGGEGAIYNSGAQQIDALLKVTLTADTTFGGTGRWDIRGSGPILNTLGTGPVNVTKVGTNQVSLVGCTCSDTDLENINVMQGTFAIQTSSTQYGDPNGLITVSSNAQIEVWGLTAGLNKNILLLDRGQIWSENNSTAISGMVFLTNNAADTAPGTGIFTNDANGTGDSLVVNSIVAGPGNLLKTGAGTTDLTAANTYTGDTAVAAGTLSLLSSGSISNSVDVIVDSGATFNVSAYSPWFVASGQTLQGSGSVTGTVSVPAGATVSGGTASTTGTLTVSGGVTLAGEALMKINGSTGASDNLTSPTIALGSQLVIANVTNVAPYIGQTFTLFTATTTGGLTGSFAGISPATPGSGLAWNTNNLSFNGSISVVAGSPVLRFSGATKSGSTVTISGGGGTADVIYYVLSTTNLSLPLNKWTIAATNVFDGNGDFNYTPTNSGGQALFYTIEQP